MEEDAESYAVIQMNTYSSVMHKKLDEYGECGFENAVQCGGSSLLYELIESDVLYNEEAAGH